MVDDDDEFVHVGRRGQRRGEQSRLADMPRILLVHSDGEQLTAAADLVRPHALQTGKAGGDQCVVNHRGLHHAAHVRVIMGRLSGGRAELNGVVPVVDPFDVHGQDRFTAAAVVAGPFSERPFRFAAVGSQPALDDNLAEGRHREPGDLAGDDVHGPTHHRPGVLELGDAAGDFGARDHQQQRVVAE